MSEISQEYYNCSQDEATGEMIKIGDEIVLDWIWKLCNMAFESGVGIGLL